MGLIQELTRYLEQANDIALYDEELTKAKTELCNVLAERDKAIFDRDCALDEIGILQKRIDSLLRQLRDKNGGN